MYNIDKISFPFPYKEVAITEDLFAAPSAIHGVGHTYRVMLLSAILVRALGWDDCGKEALWAAALHDTQRRSDGEDGDHGRQAVVLTLPRFIETMKKEGISEEGISSVAYSIEHHCVDIEFKSDCHSHKTAMILKEADALDRVRFNGLDVSYLRFENQIGSVSLAHSFFEQLLTHLVVTEGEIYLPIVRYTLSWIRKGDCTHTQYIDDCKTMFGEPVTSRFYAFLNDTSFYISFIESHAV